MECAPTQVLGDEAVTGVCFNTPDGGQETIACDAVILAVGQLPRPPVWLARFGVQVDERGLIRVDEKGQTSNARIYAGGDNTLGPDLVVTAVAAGRRAADGILDGLRPTRRVLATVRAVARQSLKQPEPVAEGCLP
jgi:glutamate synthase (NADPH/NADH) small chain